MPMKPSSVRASAAAVVFFTFCVRPVYCLPASSPSAKPSVVASAGCDLDATGLSGFTAVATGTVLTVTPLGGGAGRTLPFDLNSLAVSSTGQGGWRFTDSENHAYGVADGNFNYFCIINRSEFPVTATLASAAYTVPGHSLCLINNAGARLALSMTTDSGTQTSSLSLPFRAIVTMVCTKAHMAGKSWRTPVLSTTLTEDPVAGAVVNQPAH